jgi:hypothetical protein
MPSPERSEIRSAAVRRAFAAVLAAALLGGPAGAEVLWRYDTGG